MAAAFAVSLRHLRMTFKFAHHFMDKCAADRPVLVGLTPDVKLRAAFQARRHRSGALLAANELPAGVANCKQRDAAPVLFDRAASAAGQVRRLDSLNA